MRQFPSGSKKPPPHRLPIFAGVVYEIGLRMRGIRRTSIAQDDANRFSALKKEICTDWQFFTDAKPLQRTGLGLRRMRV
jgi:hypothetical protein